MNVRGDFLGPPHGTTTRALWEAHKKETTHCIQVLNVQDKLYITFVYSDIHVAI